jgi:hypothetical protein
MKSILYVGATLMIGASIYGFVDYKKTSQQKEFSGMYESTEVTTPVIKEEKKIPVTDVKKNGEKIEPAKTVIVEKIIPDNMVINTGSVTGSKEKKSKSVKKRKLSYKQFSRAPLREDIKELKLVEPKKEEAAKTRIETKEL